MAKKLFIGNMSWSTKKEDLEQAFSQFGTVTEAVVIEDRDTRRSKGFGFVTFENDADADAAIAGMNDKELMGRQIKVNEARPREERPRGGFGGDRF